MRNFRQQKGFMVIEVLIASSIITAAILATMAVAQKSVQASRRALHTTEAAFLLEEGAEAVRIARDNDWVNISALTADTPYYPSFSGGTWTLSTTANQVGIFTRTVEIADVERNNTTGDIAASGSEDENTKLITVNVSWQEGGEVTTKTLQFYIMNIFS